MKLGDKVSDFDKGKKLELNEVRYDEVSHTLTGIIREPTKWNTRQRNERSLSVIRPARNLSMI